MRLSRAAHHWPPTSLDEPAKSVDAPNRVAYPSNGPDVLAYVAAKYPGRLAAGVSHEERVANMRFIRDRIIEAGKCGGMDLGWNLKRGGPEISTDFLVERTSGGDRGIDIAYGYDDTAHPLRLQWMHSEWPVYKEYPATPCE